MMKEKAAHHGVGGWVRNLPDGSVEAILQGDKESVRRVVEWSRVGPPLARVTRVYEQVKDGHPMISGFRVAD